MTGTGLPPSRSALTSIIVDQLTALLAPDILVGRGVAPKAGGWAQGQPGRGAFAPYTTLKSGTARRGPIPETIGRPRMAWSMGYALTTSGQLDASADDTADYVREAMTKVVGPFDLNGHEWELVNIDFASFGPTSPNNSVNPPFWDVTDAVSLWLFRAREA